VRCSRRTSGDYRRDRKWKTGDRLVGWPRARIATHLANIADAEHDVNAYIEAIRLGQREHMDAAHVAKRLIDVGRGGESSCLA